ncbi:hypothetical protein APHAL10511_006870 [Amanita phalloides]|nr:hypothetical protein APHAL10511_006870 [Amanita phalloides]
MTILFYDIASKVGAHNPNAWKARFTLNYKGIPYKTQWTQYVDIEKVSREKGIPPSDAPHPETGGIFYTLPAIFDESTGVGVSDSHKIAEYLDKNYPDTPKVIIPGTEALQIAFTKSFMPHLSAMWQFVLPANIEALDHQESKEYFYKTRSSRFGADIKTMNPTGAAREEAFNDLKDGLDKIDQLLLKSKGPYVMGETVSFADFAVGGWLKWMQILFGKDSEEWKRVSSWNEGRWGERLERLDKYAQAD